VSMNCGLIPKYVHTILYVSAGNYNAGRSSRAGIHTVDCEGECNLRNLPHICDSKRVVGLEIEYTSNISGLSVNLIC
jgi:hypothetical protein